MTDQHLSDLLHADADRIAVPPAPAAAVLAEGRRLRRRSHVARGGAVAAGATGMAAVAALALVLARPTPTSTPAELAPAVTPDPAGWAVAQGSTVHLGSGKTVEVPGKVKAMYYTSAGVMVRTGRTPYTEGDSTSNYFVLSGDGTVRDFSLSLGDKKPGSDPSLPYLAYSVKGGPQDWELVLRDVRTGEVATRVPYDGAFTWGGWNAPPTALSGDFAYVGVDDATLRINWRTGDVEKAKGLSAGRMPTVMGGNELVEDHDDRPDGVMLNPDDPVQLTHQVLDAESGQALRSVEVTGTVMSTPVPQLSADGRHVLLKPWLMCEEDGDCTYETPTAEVVSVTTGDRRTFTIGAGTFGWSPDGRLLLVQESEVRSCDADTGECVATPVTLEGAGPVRVSGNDNES
ncbi:hypothetical protein [Nocardioides sp.]|uniref:hypothetical protein n=1 Tax=Nocardioides sp. TaxID=35761 RepID=UPI002BEBDF2F|nr:hypothetical protein [Nocardioides sp.]HSX67620.1 hypothetical protein [Nocardioides sp.]